MASLLAKFRIDYSDLTVIPDITKKPQEKTSAFFESLIKDIKVSDEDNTEGNRNEGKLTHNQDTWFLKLHFWWVEFY